MRLLIDVSSVLWQSLLAGKDQEFGKLVEHEGKQVHVNGWQFGLECAISHVTLVMRELDLVPNQLIFVVEGKNSKARRKAIYAGYKDGRGSRPPEAYDQFNRCKEELTQTFRNVGAHIVSQDGVEADDVIAYLSLNLEGEKVILSNDGDLAALITDKVSLYRKGKLNTENPYGPFPSQFITVYKSLVGDSSDNIKGAPGFGEKAFLDFLVWAGDSGLAAVEGVIKRQELHTLEDDVAEFRPMRKIIDGATSVYTSYQVAKLYPEWCNTLRQPLQWKAGMVRGRDVVTDERLWPFAQQVRLITAQNYDQTLTFFKEKVQESPIVSLDIETSTPEESDEWLRSRDAEAKVDVFGSELTGMGLTFGRNNQYTFYFSVDHADTDNVTTDQVRDVVAVIPQGTPIVIQNFAFEGPILWNLWGKEWENNGWHGFLPNVVDTKVLANYTDENVSSGLKQGSKLYLDYDQTTYQEVTTQRLLASGWDKRGRVIKQYRAGLTGEEAADLELHDWIEVQRKMNDLTGEHVLAYGADDTICTAALFNHFRIRTEIEKTWHLINEVEQKPAYLTAYAFTQGTKFSLERMKQLEAADREAYAKAWQMIREFLIDKGWEGTVTPVYTELTPAAVKEIVQIVLGDELKTMVRTISKLAKLVEVMDHADAPLLAKYIEEGNLTQINDLVAHRFDGEPRLDINSPKQMKNLLYTVLNLPVRLVNSCTPNERKEKPDLANAVYRYRKIANGSNSELPLTDAEKTLLKAKARTDDTAADFALKFDCTDPDSETAKVVNALMTMKSTDTKAKLFYRPYANIKHWKTGRVHAQVNQCATVTRRWSASSPNLQQLPKTKGVAFRECYIPHRKDAVICSVDFAGQELRLQAGLSGDREMLSCYVGDNLRDMHSITASGAMRVVWSKAQLTGASSTLSVVPDNDYELFLALLKSPDKKVAKMAKDLRTLSKGVNFGSAYGCEAPKMQELLVTDLQTASDMLDAKLKKFNGYETWKEKVEDEAMRRGHVSTLLGGRRHLAHAIMSEDKWEAQRAARQASNFMIQSAGAELAKRALTRLWDSGIFFNLDAVPIAPIHDEYVWSVHRDHAYESIVAVWNAIAQPYTKDFPVPFIGSISLGANFGQQIELGEAPDREVTEKALAEIFDTVTA